MTGRRILPAKPADYFLSTSSPAGRARLPWFPELPGAPNHPCSAMTAGASQHTAASSLSLAPGGEGAITSSPASRT